jgi:uncharacterized Zn finger protein (UPF0148 family)
VSASPSTSLTQTGAAMTVTAKYCPRCGQPLSESQDPARLCVVCGWFGDQQETLTVPPPQAEIVRDLGAILDIYRSMCRDEMRLEALVSMNQSTDADLDHGRQFISFSRQAIMEMFLRLCPSQLKD